MDDDMKDVEELKTTLKRYIDTKENLVKLDEKKKADKIANVQMYKKQTKEFRQKLKPAPVTNELQKGFCAKERKKNIALKQEVEKLHRDYHCFEGITNDSDLDLLLFELERDYTRIIDLSGMRLSDESTKSPSRLSFSFDSSM